MENSIFIHSVKVPQLYKDASKLIRKIVENNCGLKESLYSKDNKFNRNKQRAFVLLTNIFGKFKKIEHILKNTEILIKEPRLDPWLTRVLIHELVWRKELTDGSIPSQIVSSYKKEINDVLSSYKEDFDSLPSTKKVFKPRYARVNTFKKSVAEVVNYLRSEGMILIQSCFSSYSEYLDAVASLSRNYFLVDFHVDELLVFSRDTCLITHELYKNNTIILQDKSSCLAPLLLDPDEGSVVLDMCAAPGMKTNYLANLVGKFGRVYALEINERRYLTMCKLLDQMEMKNICCMLKNATDVTGDTFDVDYILVDPSCSGSGITDRIDYESSKPDRLQYLATFQTKILTHALTKFPTVKRVVYSTCSIHPEENEQVICNVLNDVKNFKLVNLQEKCKPNWFHFGSDKYGEIGTSCLYTKAEKDLTNGFFIAVFERLMKETKFDNDKNTELYDIEQNINTKTTDYGEEMKVNKEKKNKIRDMEYVEETIKIEKKKKDKREAKDDTNNDIQYSAKKIKKAKKNKIYDDKEEYCEEEKNNDDLKSDISTKEKKKRTKKENEELEVSEKVVSYNNEGNINSTQYVEETIKIKKKKKDKGEAKDDTDNDIQHSAKKIKKAKKNKIYDDKEEYYEEKKNNDDLKSDISTKEKKKRTKKENEELEVAEKVVSYNNEGNINSTEYVEETIKIKKRKTNEGEVKDDTDNDIQYSAKKMKKIKM